MSALSSAYMKVSRQFPVLGGASGVEALGRATVAIVGCGPLVAEAIKDLALMGVGELQLFCEGLVTQEDVNTNFLLANQEGRIGNEMAVVILERISYWFPDVKVTVHREGELLVRISNQSAVLYAEGPIPDKLSLQCDEKCRQLGIPFIAAQSIGVAGAIFNDFGPSTFTFDLGIEKMDKTIDQIKFVDDALEGTVLVINAADLSHGLTLFDTITFSGTALNCLNEASEPFPIADILTETSFSISASSLTKLSGTSGSTFPGGGSYQRVSITDTLPPSVSLQQSLSTAPSFPSTCDLHTSMTVFGLIKAYSTFVQDTGCSPHVWDDRDTKSIVDTVNSYNFPVSKELLEKLAPQVGGVVFGLNSILGGLASQEVIKALLHLHTPVHQWYFISADDCLPDVKPLDTTGKGSRYDKGAEIFGWSTQERLMRLRPFLVGAGALGCEYIKNFAMTGIACEDSGCIVVTDHDSISKSNLNRQLLFRESDVERNKAVTALSRAIIDLNSSLSAHSRALQLQVEACFEGEFSDSLWENIDAIICGVDNVEARVLLNEKAHFYHLPMFEAGTEGLVCSCKVVIPYYTAEYSPPVVGANVAKAVCTGKTFPFNPIHCMEWGKDRFNEIFWEKGSVFAEMARQPDWPLTVNMSCQQIQDHFDICEKSSNIVSLYSGLQHNQEQKQAWIHSQLRTWFVTEIEKLLTVHPAESVDEKGVPFWTGFKICPKPLREICEATCTSNVWKNMLVKSCSDLLDLLFGTNKSFYFNKDDPTHLKFVSSAGNLLSMTRGLPIKEITEAHALAGSIIPAIVTSTSIAAGLVSLELYKLSGTSSKATSYSGYCCLRSNKLSRTPSKPAGTSSRGLPCFSSTIIHCTGAPVTIIQVRMACLQAIAKNHLCSDHKFTLQSLLISIGKREISMPGKRDAEKPFLQLIEENLGHTLPGDIHWARIVAGVSCLPETVLIIKCPILRS
ncbi:Ubiquitin-activating enzyme E1 1 [Pelomyxa schiedti]|nr:Ubiquitin-activating enzyme E1 1 [Pelomyxa schiedti]